MSLASAILANPDLRRRFIVGVNPDTHNPEWNKIELRNWLFQYSQFEEIQISRAEMTGGGPGHLAELAAMNRSNTQTRHKRNFCILWPYVSVLRMYVKTGNISGQDKLIPHALDGLSSDLLIQDQVLARPFAIMAVKMCFPDRPDIHQLYEERLFVNNCKEYVSRDITNCMVRFTSPVVGVGLGINDWRHISKAFKQKLCNQAGRTRSTGNRVYAVSHDTLAGIAEDVLPLFLESSTDWQKILGVVPGGLGLVYKAAKGIHYAQLIGNGIIAPLHREAQRQEQLDINKLVTLIVDRLKSELVRDLSIISSRHKTLEKIPIDTDTSSSEFS
jgi:hypothetical protein